MFYSEEVDVDDSNLQPEQLVEDKQPKGQGEELVEINFAAQGEETQPIFLGANLPSEQRRALLFLLHEFKDVFVGYMPRC